MPVLAVYGADGPVRPFADGAPPPRDLLVKPRRGHGGRRQMIWRWDGDRHVAAEPVAEPDLEAWLTAAARSGDLLVQEYGRYFGMKTVIFRGGCLTGPNHSGAELHGFLGYLMQCAVTGSAYTVFGYKGKQVRDNIHSHDLIKAFDCFFNKPSSGQVYNIGGGRQNSCSILEAIAACEKILGQKMKYTYSEENRSGDHIWYISHLGKFQSHYPQWKQQYGLDEIMAQIYDKITSDDFSQ
ncbi:MAG: NAD-dependent epimerase/dehydratase family protein [Proteobacteria bacterium]|nr:NAD-dependent epimerase/dehydratase family protein [Pseudomonadota bacterium]